VGELDGQVAIVTGSGRGIGRAIALALAAAGAAVSVTARSADQVADTVSRIEQGGGRALGVVADVTDADAMVHLVARAERELGAVDLVVANAGRITPIAPVWEADPAEWRRCFETNVLGTFHCARAVLPGMVARRRGRIITLAGSDPAMPTPYFTAYDSTKAAILRFTESLAAEVREFGITVFAVAPGGVHTAMVDDLVASPWSQWLGPDVGNFEKSWLTPPEQAGALCVLLATGRADALSGRRLHVAQDAEELVRRTEEIQQQDLYTLRMRT
jgi:NAD(P)-dependent dehydrogenase (short-subunit alcohol dehydrogenase family)